MKCETNLNEGIRKILETRKPGMVIIHKSTCKACVTLKPKLLASKEINNLSNFFVVISLMDDDTPKEQKWGPDGKYVPRIFFLDVCGEIMLNITNLDGNPRFKYYYSNEKSLVNSMQTVLKTFPTNTAMVAHRIGAK